MSSFQLDLANTYYFQEKLEMFTYKQVYNSLADYAYQKFYSAAKSAKFSIFKTCKLAVADKILGALQRARKLLWIKANLF